MPDTQSEIRYVRFGAFEADLRTRELRKNGVRLKFTGQPFHVLAILLERPGELVTREELQNRVWPDTIVDVERNLNTAINKVREVLGMCRTIRASSKPFLGAATGLSRRSKSPTNVSMDSRRVQQRCRQTQISTLSPNQPSGS